MRKIILLSFVILVFGNTFAHARSIYGDQYIEITSPTNEEVWQIGTEQIVTWESANISGQVQIRLDYLGSSRTVGWANIDLGLYTFTVPDYFPERDDWHVIVTSFGGASDGGDIWDNSEAITLTNTVQSDSDDDGVSDKLDQCPDTLIGENVDENGCSAFQLVTDGERFIDNEDGTITDLQTSLMWQKGYSENSYYVHPSQYPKVSTYPNVLNQQKLAGYTDWRLPNKDELKSLVMCSNGKPTPLTDNYDETCGGDSFDDYDKPTIDPVFLCSNSYYYTGQQAPASHAMVNYYVNFSNGRLGYTDGGAKTRCVRTHHIHEPPIVAIISPSSDSEFRLNELIEFQANVQNPAGSITTYFWEFGDGSHDDIQNPTHAYNSEGTYIVTLTVTGEDGETFSDSINIIIGSESEEADIIINIKDEAGNSLNGYLLIKLPPPAVNPLHPDMEDSFWPYFHDNSKVDMIATSYGYLHISGYVLKSYYIYNGNIQINLNDITDYDKFNLLNYYAKTNHLVKDETRFLFFYPDESNTPAYTSDQELEVPTVTSNGDMTWWTLHYRRKDEAPFIQNVTMVLKDKDGEDLDDWTEGWNCDYGDCYSPNHRDKQNFVLEAATSTSGIYSGSKNPVLLIHGINGQSGYWEDNIVNLRNNNDTKNTWVFNYRGTEDISNSAYLLSLAVADIKERYNKELNLITHSYGGVVARNYCLSYSEASDSIHKLLMIAPPHHGSYSAKRVYEKDKVALLQRLWIAQDWTKDPNAPVYKELTPGSTNLMEMAKRDFPDGITPLVIAGTKPKTVQDLVHDEAPMHDDGPVSISSASLLPVGVPLGFISLNHSDQRKHEDTATLIKQFVGSSIPVGENEIIKYLIEDLKAGSYPREASSGLPTYHDEYPHPSATPLVLLDRGGLIVDCRDNPEITKIVWSRSGSVHELKKNNDHNVYYYYLNNNGLAVPVRDEYLEPAYSENMTLNFYANDEIVLTQEVTVYPCANEIYEVDESKNTTILTQVSSNHIVSSSKEYIYGTSSSNQIILESGSMAELINFPGQNSIQIQSSSDLFAVSRSGTLVTFQGTDGTVLKIPATTDVQTIDFTDREPLTLNIHENKVMLDDQEVTRIQVPIEGDLCDEQIFYDSFDYLDSEKWNFNHSWNSNNFDSKEYFLEPSISNGSMIIRGKEILEELESDNQAYWGLSTLNKTLQGDFEMITHIENYSVETDYLAEGWWSSFYLWLGTDTHWENGERIHIRISKGNEHYGDYDGFGLFYYKHGIKQDIGCNYDDGTNCWINKADVIGDTDKITVRRVSDNVNLYIGDSLLHSFSNATTEDLYLTLNTGMFNEVRGTFKNYYLEIPEIKVNKYCDGNDLLKYDDGFMDKGLKPYSDEVGSEVAVRFTPYSYPSTIEKAYFYVSGASGEAASTLFEVKVYDDDNGIYPGTLLNSSSIYGSARKANEWVGIDVSQLNLEITEGDFFVSMYWLSAPGASGQNISQTIGLDTNEPVDERSFLKWGMRDRWHTMSSMTSNSKNSDAMIRVETKSASEKFDSCGAYIAPNAWKEFDCYNLAAIGKETGVDPFTPSWELIGGYWQWGRKGPGPSHWYNSNNEHFAHGPTGPGNSESNNVNICNPYLDYATYGSWSDSEEKSNDPCPLGFRVPTIDEWEGALANNEKEYVGDSWTSGATNYKTGLKLGDALFLPAAGFYSYDFDDDNCWDLSSRGYSGHYWSSSEDGSSNAWYLHFDSGRALKGNRSRWVGFPVRCIAE